MWSGTLSYLDTREVYFRLNQLLQVIARLKTEQCPCLTTSLFELIILTSYRQDNYFRITKRIFETMQKYGLTASTTIQRYYLLHYKKHLMEVKQKNRAGVKTQHESGHIQRMQQPNRIKQKTDQNVLSDKEYLICKKEEQILNPNSKLYKRIGHEYKFRKRTFKTEKIKNIV
jgi:hypothetical protein